MECFYAPELEAQSKTISLDAEQVRHVHVLRYAVGDRLYVSNGRGIRAVAVITALNRTSVELKVEQIELQPGELPHRLTVAVGVLAATDRMEWLLEKCTELGVHSIVPVQYDRTERSRLHRPERLHAKMLAALKQSQRSIMPTLAQPIGLEALLQETSGVIIVCDPAGKSPDVPDGDCTIVVGPEGGFSPREEVLLRQWEHQRWSLGGLRLRSETAVIAAVSVVAAAWRA